MNNEQQRTISKRLSYVLRHRPDSVGIRLDDAGWADVEDLLDGFAIHGKALSIEQLYQVVETNPKQRFEFNNERLRIRARQGHSIEVQLGYAPAIPPDVLFHGTPRGSVESISETGLDKRQRHHVHMSTDRNLMLEVARRRGDPVLIQIDAARMHEAGYEFYVTGNDVWLTEHVPPEFLSAKNP